RGVVVDADDEEQIAVPVDVRRWRGHVRVDRRIRKLEGEGATVAGIGARDVVAAAVEHFELQGDHSAPSRSLSGRAVEIRKRAVGRIVDVDPGLRWIRDLEEIVLRSDELRAERDRMDV